MPEGEEANQQIKSDQPHLLGSTWINYVPIMGILRRKIQSSNWDLASFFFFFPHQLWDYSKLVHFCFLVWLF